MLLLRKRRWTLSILAGYAILVLAGTVLIRASSPEPQYQLQLFWSYAQWDVQKRQILANVIMFIPIGFLAGKDFGRKGILIAAGFSLLIESIQLLTCRGLFEFDDIIHNTAGAVIGYSCFVLTEKLFRKIVGNR